MELVLSLNSVDVSIMSGEENLLKYGKSTSHLKCSCASGGG
jgi:hypothetical protein